MKHTIVTAGNGSLIIYENNKIGNNFFNGHYVLIRQNNEIGNNVKIGSYTEISYNVIIEDNVKIHSMCFIPEYTVLKKGCWLGPRVTICNDPYPQSGGKHRKGVTIEEGAIIGANTTILAGVTIGKNSFIGANSLVTKDVPAGQAWWGSPAEYKKNKKYLKAYETTIK